MYFIYNQTNMSQGYVVSFQAFLLADNLGCKLKTKEFCLPTHPFI